MKKIIALVLVIALCCSISVGLTVAYLTDRDSKANVFTVGDVKIGLNEEFEPGATLIPGVDIEKKPTITNTGKNDAWVWLEFAIPAALDNYVEGTETGSNENVIHWNPSGATTEGYVNDTRVQNAINAGILTDSTLTAEYIEANKMHWNVFNSIDTGKNVYKTKINGVDYNVYVLLYNKALEPGETTLPNIYKVFLDAQVDIDPEGNWYKIVNGQPTTTDPLWNSNTDGNPVIYASAYAMQTEGLADANNDGVVDVKDAYKAYQAQWGTGDAGKEWGAPANVSNVADLDGLKDALQSKDPVIVDAGGNDLGDMDNTTFNDGAVIKNATFNGDEDHGSYGNDAYGTVTFINCTFTSEYAYAAHFDGGNGELVFIDCTFEGWNSFGNAITGLTFENCTFGHNGYFGLVRVYQDATFTNCTFESELEGVDTNVTGTTVHFNNCTGIDGKIHNNGSNVGVWYIDGVDVSSTATSW